MIRLFLLAVITFGALHSLAQSNPARQADPRAIQIITKDIPRFWVAFDSSKQDPSRREEIFQTLYFIGGSKGLDDFNSQSIKGAKKLADATIKYDLYYQSIRNNTLHVSRKKKRIINALIKFKKLYEDASFPPVYFVIGDLNSGGRASENGLLIGTEVNSADKDSDFTNIYPPFIPTLKSLTVKNIPNVVTHELIHYQQNYADEELDLLGNVLKEGIADFIAELTTGIRSNANIRAYGNRHELQLWMQFKQSQENNDMGKWLYNSGTDEWPGNLGYYIGYRIAEAYYKNSSSKKHAIREMLTIVDFGRFLAESRYEQHLTKRHRAIK